MTVLQSLLKEFSKGLFCCVQGTSSRLLALLLRFAGGSERGCYEESRERTEIGEDTDSDRSRERTSETRGNLITSDHRPATFFPRSSGSRLASGTRGKERRNRYCLERIRRKARLTSSWERARRSPHVTGEMRRERYHLSRVPFGLDGTISAHSTFSLVLSIRSIIIIIISDVIVIIIVINAKYSP